MGSSTTKRPPPAHLEAAEADAAGRAVFAWALIPAAGRLVHEVAEGHDTREAVDELRAAVRVLDRVGWPSDRSEAIHLTPAETDLVQRAAEAHAARGLNPDQRARARVARGHISEPPPRRNGTRALLEALERARR
jgi:hypothetical protein